MGCEAPAFPLLPRERNQLKLEAKARGKGVKGRGAEPGPPSEPQFPSNRGGTRTQMKGQPGTPIVNLFHERMAGTGDAEMSSTQPLPS